MPRQNNFDVIRLFLAWVVVLTHCQNLSKAAAFDHLIPLLQSARAVEAFFAISGCLVVASWNRKLNPRQYFLHRARRILPAYWFALACCLVLGSGMSTLSGPSFWLHSDTWRYVLYNIVFMNYAHPNLPGVFTTNVGNSAMDGALWTIKLEVGFYLLVPLLVLAIRRIGRAWVLGSVFVASTAFSMIAHSLNHPNLAKQLPGQLCFFIVGTAVYYYFPLFVMHRKLIWWLSIPMLIVAVYTNWFILNAIAVPLVTMAVAFLLPNYRGVTKYGDFSYGTYVLHYPIVQTFVALGLFVSHPWIAILVVALCVVAASLISWYGVERSFLRTKKVSLPQPKKQAEAAVIV